MDGSYKLESFTDNKESEVNRLKFQVDLFFRKEMDLYKKIGLRDGMKIIECGSGPGFLIRNIVLELPLCNATALEIDPFLAGQADKNSELDGKKLFDVKNASVYDTGLPDNCFDFAIARLVFEHLNEPDKAIAEMRRILKPGGKLVLVSNDFAYHLMTYPSIPELDEMYTAYIESRFSEGGNPLIGRQLPTLLKKAKMTNINIEIICVHSELEGDKPFLKAENVNISKSLVKDGYLKKESLDSLAENWYKMLQQPDHVLFRQLFVISGIKSSGPSARNENLHENHLTHYGAQTLTLENLKGMDRSVQESALDSYLINKVQAITEHQNAELALNTRLSDIDIDSIAAAELSGIVKSDFNTTISISNILQKYSINDIAELILINLIANPAINAEGLVDRTAVKWLEGDL